MVSALSSSSSAPAAATDDSSAAAAATASSAHSAAKFGLPVGHVANLSETARSEFTSNMQKFATQIAQTIQQVSLLQKISGNLHEL